MFSSGTEHSLERENKEISERFLRATSNATYARRFRIFRHRSVQGTIHKRTRVILFSIKRRRFGFLLHYAKSQDVEELRKSSSPCKGVPLFRGELSVALLELCRG